MANEQYIKMCDHPVIQGGWEPTEGDFYIGYNRELYTNGYTSIEIVDGYIRQFKEKFHRQILSDKHNFQGVSGRIIWLPRLDQLLGMLPYKKDVLLDLERDYLPNDWCFVRYEPNIERLEFFADTPEQAVIQGVMHEHGLKWDGEKWVAVED